MTVLTLAEAEDMAERTLVPILARVADPASSQVWEDLAEYFLERLASDLAGLREHWSDAFHQTMQACDSDGREWPCSDARRYSDNLRRIAELYGSCDDGR